MSRAWPCINSPCGIFLINPEKLKDVLGAQRYEQLQFSLDPANEFFVRLVARVNLPLETAISAKALEKSSLNDWNTAKQVRPATRATADHANAIRNEAAERFKSLLGTEGYKIYEQGAGNWLRMP